MKKLICLFLGIISLFTFVGCADNSSYKVPEDCCVVSVPEGFELWTAQDGPCNKIDTPIKGMEREEGKNYYVITKNTPFSIVNFENYVCDEGTHGQGKVVTGFNADGNIFSYSPSQYNEVTLSCNKNTDISPVYKDFKSVGLAVFVADASEGAWNSVWNLDAYFNADGSVKETENFYYVIEQELDNDTLLPEYIPRLPQFKTNFTKIDDEITIKSATYTIKRDFIAEGQTVLYCVLNRYDANKYFIAGTALGDDFPASLISTTVELGKDYILTVKFEGRGVEL